MNRNDIKEQTLEILGELSFPGFQRDIVSMGMVQDLEVGDKRLAFRLVPGSSDLEAVNRLEEACRKALESLSGVEAVEISVDHGASGNLEPQTSPDGHARRHGQPGPAPGFAEQQRLPGVKRIIAVASGKGGVGKSTVAVNLAAALKARGNATGLMDADIYGPSIPTMMGICEMPQVIDSRIMPVQAHGISTMSMGYFVEPDKAVIWRGPMVMKAIQQFLQDAEWGDLDYLVVDLPPGTGDAQLSLVQLVPLDGAVVVTTPQEVALTDARKAVNMFQTTGCPVLGIVENMSHFVCPKCGEETEIFSRGGGRAAAKTLGVPFLGEVPITSRVRESSDAGTPLVISDPDSPAAEAFVAVAGAVLEVLGAPKD